MATKPFKNCAMLGVESPTPSKNNITENYNTTDFDAIKVSIVGEVTYTQSDTKNVQIYGPDNIIPYIEVDVKRNTLSITTKNNIKVSQKCNLKVMISCPEIKKITTIGIGDFKLKGKVKAKKPTLNLEGIGNIVAYNLDCKDLRAGSSGVGNIKLKGKAVEANYSVLGMGDIEAYKLAAGHVRIEASGLGGIQCNASQAIKAELSGVGSVLFKGNPKKKNFSRNGVGIIEQVD